MTTNGAGGVRVNRPNEPQKILLTREGYQEKVARLEMLKKRREEIADYIHEAKEAGDISESSAYEDAKNRQALNEGEILELQRILENADILEDQPQEAEGAKVVRIGANVEIEAKDGTRRTFQMVSTHEANSVANKLSDQSPVGRALMGHSEGDTVEVATPSGTNVVYKIVTIG
jgi:transcription elongation factor GreA